MTRRARARPVPKTTSNRPRSVHRDILVTEAWAILRAIPEFRMFQSISKPMHGNLALQARNIEDQAGIRGTL